MADYLSYGDKICLYADETDGFVHSDSSSSFSNEIRIYKDQDKFNPKDVHNITTMLFEVVLVNRYKLYKNFWKTFGNEAVNSVDIDIRVQAEQAKAALVSEQEDNELEQKRNLGKVVYYGDIIQLRHIFSKRYIHVNTSKTSYMDKNSMILNLQSHNSKSAQFKIIPRYKVKYEGEIVQYMDLVSFESVKAPLHFFHASDFYQIDHFFNGAELNLSVEPSGFTLIRSSKAEVGEDEHNVPIVHTGDYVQLVHKEIDAYLESFSPSVVDKMNRKVKLRLRQLIPTASSANYKLSTSAVTFWQIERETQKILTECGKWSYNYRFRHATNRMYLCMKKNLQLCLSKYPKSNTVFKLHPNIDQDNIKYNSVFRIEHVLTGTWLHGKRELSESEDVIGTGSITEKTFENLQWEYREYRDIEGVEQRLYDDAFVIYHVPDQVEYSFSLMSGFVPLLENILYDRENHIEYGASDSHKYKVAVEEIRDSLMTHGVPEKIRQRHLRNLEMVDIIVKIVRVPFFDKHDCTFVQKIYLAFYEVLHNYMKGSCLKNSLYFAKYVHLFLPKMLEGGELGSKITEMITELIKDNKRVLECLRFENVGPFIDSLREVQNPRFLEYLMAFCVCSSEAWPSNQRQVAFKWLKEDFRGVYLTERGQNISMRDNVLYIKTSPEDKWLQMDVFLEENTSGSGQITKEYFLKQIDLILAICYGRNEECRELVLHQLSYISWEECYGAISSDLLPHYIKIKYFNIIETFFIDIGTNYSVIDSPKYNFIYNQIHGKKPIAVECMFTVPSERVTNRIFVDLTNWIFGFLENQPCLYSDQPELNYLNQRVLSLINKLIQYGYFDSTTITRIMGSLLRLLNGKNDMPFESDSKKESTKKLKKTIQKFRSKLRFENSSENEAIIAAKMAGLDIVESILIYERVSVVSLLISKFKQCESPDEKEQRKRLKGHTHLIPCLQSHFDVDKQFKKSTRGTKKMVKEIESMFHNSRIVHPDQWTSILIDLAYYESDDMNQKSLLILHKIYTLKDSAFLDTYGTFIAKSSSSRELQEKMCNYVPRLKLIVKSDIKDTQLNIISEIVQDLIKVCRMDNEEDIINPVSQRIITGYGILPLCFEIIVQIRRAFTNKSLNLRANNVIILIAKLLRHLAISNSSFQEDLFNQLDILLDLFDDTSKSNQESTSTKFVSTKAPPSELAHLLRQGLFENNRGFCTRIKAYQLSRLMGIVARIAKNNPQVGASFVLMLQSLVVIDHGRTPLKRNQLLIMKFLMKNFSYVVYVLDNKGMTRKELLTNNANSDNALYFVRIVDLFVACCLGENQYVQSLCQTIIPLEELLELLGNKSIHITFKRGLLQYLCRVYLSKASLINREGAVRNFLGSTYLEELLVILKNTVDLTDTNLHNNEKYNLISLLKRPFTEKPPPNSQFLENVKLFLENIIYGSSIFMANLCTACCFLDYKLPDNLMNLVKYINKKILDVFSVLFKYQLQPSTFATITESMALIIPFSGLSAVEAKTIVLMHCKPQIMFEDPRKEIDQKHADEIELNLSLQTFLFNCSQLIAGRNTVKDQLNINNRKQYVKPNDQNALPLSRDFQSHIKAFLNLNYSRNDTKRYRDVDVLIRQLETSGALVKEGRRSKLINKLDQDCLDLRCLQILRGLIYNEETLLPSNWEIRILEPDVQDALKAVKQVQECLNKLEISNRTQVHMINPCDSVRKEVLILQSAVLINGNVSVQNSMLQYFLSVKDEVFFGAIRHQLQDAFDDLKDQKLLTITKKLDLDVENFNFVECLEEGINMKEISYQLKQQLMTFESKYDDHQRSLALNESFSMRKFRQLLTPKLETNNTNCCLCCYPNQKKYDVKSNESHVKKIEANGNSNHIEDEFELKVVVEDPKSKSKSNFRSKRYQVEDCHSNTDNDNNEEVINHNNNGLDLASLAKNDPQQQVKLVLQLLSRMCVGQYHGLQNYLRSQPDNYASVDIVSLVVHFLSGIYSNVNPTNIDLNIMTFETIKEAILGNQENRTVVYRAKVVDCANFILRNVELREICEAEKILKLYSSIGRVIVALIEENGSQATALAKEIKMTIDISAIYNVLEYCQKQIDNTKDAATKEKIYDMGFNYYIILARFEDLDIGKSKREAIATEQQLKAFRQFKKGAASIEILKEDELQRVHFRLKSKEVLRESVKEKVKWEVDRTTPSNKIRSFMIWSKLIVPDMSFQRRIIGNPLLLFLTKQWDTLNYLMTILSLVICILLLIGVEAPAGGFLDFSGPSKPRNPEFDNRYIKWKPQYQLFEDVIVGLGAAHSTICFLILLTYLITDRPTIRTISGYFRTFKKYIVGLFKKEELNEEQEKEANKNVSLFSIIRFIYCCLCLGLSIYGYWMPYVFTFHLFNIIHNNQLLKGVIASVTTNGRVLIWVMILMIIVMYIFTIFAFCFFRSTFNPENNLYSGTLVQTFVTIIRFGIIGDLYEQTMPHEKEKSSIEAAFSRFSVIVVFQILFFIVITITGLNIVFGIIVDSFSELRDLKFKAEKDMKEMCFICSRVGHDFDHSRSNFSQHVQSEHNMWTYLFYILHLKEKNISDYYHLDLYVANLLKRENYEFFPINRALSLTAEEKTDSRVSEIYHKVEQVKEYRQNEERENIKRRNFMLQSEWRQQNQFNEGSSSDDHAEDNNESAQLEPSTSNNQSSFLNMVRQRLPKRSRNT